MNVPYRNPIYSKINTVGRTWIFKYTLALSREIEAHIRIQFANVNIQGVGSLQGSELVADARTEKEQLVTELKEMLNETSRKGQLERKQQESQFQRDALQQVPLPIYIF
jgi:ribosomal protein S13